MPSISTCSECGRPVVVPDELAESTAVRCPLCGAEYPAVGVMELTADIDEADEGGDFPPELIPVDRSKETEADSTDDESGLPVKCPSCEARFGLAELIVAATGEKLGPQAAAAIGPDGSAAIGVEKPDQDHTPYEIAIDTGSEATPAATGAFDFQDADADRRDSALASVAAVGRVRKQGDGGKHPLRLMAEIVFGGVAGLALTYYGLNFFGGPRFDWFEVYLPGVAHTADQCPSWWPAMAGEPDSDQTDTEPISTPTETPVEPSVVGEGAFGAGAGPVETEPPKTGGLKTGPVETEPEDPLMEATVPFEKPSEEPRVEPAKEASEERPAEPPPPPPVGLAEPPSFTSDELGQILKIAHGSFGAGGLTDETYRQLCQVAQAATFVELADGGPKLRNRLEAVEILLQKIGAEELNLVKIAKMANDLAYDSTRPENGILLSGTVESTLKLGQAHGTSVQLSGTENPLVVVSESPISAEVGDRVLVLGSVVDKPAENMVGVETSMRRVIWSRMSVNLGK